MRGPDLLETFSPLGKEVAWDASILLVKAFGGCVEHIPTMDYFRRIKDIEKVQDMFIKEYDRKDIALITGLHIDTVKNYITRY